MKTDDFNLAVWTRKYINSLPDSAFLYIESGGKKDSEGKTVPRSLRHFPYKDASGKIDLPHLRNAVARIPQSNLPASVKERVQAKARSILEKNKGKASQPEGIYVAAHEGFFALAVGAKKEAENEDPIQKFKKDIISVGTYIHPVFEWVLDVTRERLFQWVAAFEAMRENGVDVEVPLNHSLDAKDNLGYVVDMFVEQNDDGVDTLFGIHEIRGEDAIDIIKRNKNTSVWVEQDCVDGKGNHYGEAIKHNSIVQQPVVPGQGDFVPVSKAASAGVTGSVEKIPIFTKMSKGEEAMNEETLKALRELLGQGEDLTEDNALSRIEERIKNLTDKNKELTEANVALDAQVKEKQSTKASKELSIDPNLAEQMASTAEQQLELAVKAGKATPAFANKLKEIFVGKTGERNTKMLSIAQDGSSSLFSRLLKALEENDITQLAEQTGLQVLSREFPADESPSEEDENAIKEAGDDMVASVGGKVEAKTE